MRDEDTQIGLAIERFASKVTVPVLHETSDEVVDQKGTGTLFDHDGRLFLITAGHIFDEIDPESLVIPSMNTTALFGIGPYELARADRPEVDIAVVELRHPPSIERARSGWQVLSLENVGTASLNGQFALIGYPSELLNPRGGMLGGTLLTMYTERLRDLPEDVEDPVVEGLDLFFRYERETEDLQGRSATAPKLHGCSGASVWEYREPENMSVWTAEQCLKIVGVQASYFGKGKWFRAKDWSYVRKMIAMLCNRRTRPA